MATVMPPADFQMEIVPGSVKNAMSGAAAAPVMGGAGGLYRVPFKAIRPIPGFNARVENKDYLDHVATLKSSIKSEGYYPDLPMSGYVGKDGDDQVIFLTAGYSRHRALSELIAEEGNDFSEDFPVPFIVKPAGQSLEDLTVALANGNEGRKLSVYEKALVLKRLISMGVEKPRAAERLGMTERYADDMLTLAGASAQIRNHVINGKISPTEAVRQIKADPKNATKKVNDAVAKATAEGKAKATGKHVETTAGVRAPKAPKAAAPKADDDGAPDGMVRNTYNFDFAQGAILPTDDIRAVAKFEDGSWWDFVDDKTDKEHVIIQRGVKISVTVDMDEEVTEDEDLKAADVDADADADPDADPDAAADPDDTAGL
jgi:hypothetical protein